MCVTLFDAPAHYGKSLMISKMMSWAFTEREYTWLEVNPQKSETEPKDVGHNWEPVAPYSNLSVLLENVVEVTSHQLLVTLIYYSNKTTKLLLPKNAAISLSSFKLYASSTLDAEIYRRSENIRLSLFLTLLVITNQIGMHPQIT